MILCLCGALCFVFQKRLKTGYKHFNFLCRSPQLLNYLFHLCQDFTVEHISWGHISKYMDICGSFLLFFFIQFNVPFKIISLIETSQSIGRAKWENPGKTT